ncbi:TetR/AcrR family transcriptional regulator [Acanthopleuribacter pedis]|uniref:TetR/AcrR family transcriptional regulator n=1 Tax=Acanthopleuribacter pedis TaxID=442870 RepID=A0A8J7U4J3_9BACT|nr:TetR/AcrR family transcriptional regulator [Acanthopleuribacter pedis]MBO1320702.1 TetR/AcrR family transcriptional regulator [Acanthopleuribacter pedis]
MAKRVRAVDWLEQGLHLLSAEGVHALTIDRLCTTLEKSKGSFYHHFKDMAAYNAALLHLWQERHTTDVIRQVEQDADRAGRNQRLNAVVLKLDHRLDQIIRGWARHDPRAALAVQQVDQLRLGYMAELFEARALPAETARALAEMEYTTFLGAQQRFVDLGAPQSAAVRQTLIDAIEAYIHRPDVTQ